MKILIKLKGARGKIKLGLLMMMIKKSITDLQAVPMNYNFWGLMMVMVFMSQYSSAAVEGFEFVVGGNDWVVSPTESYNHWAGRTRFSINDSLLFRYKAGQDSVLVVNREDYENCNTQHPIKSYTDGNSVFVFDRSGPFYFISGAPTHCYRGQKLIVVVLAEHHHLPSPPQTTPAPTLSPPSITPTRAPSQPPTHVHPPTPTPTPSHVSQPPSHVPSLPPTDHVHPPSPSPGPSHVSQPPVYVHAPSPSSPSPKASSPAPSSSPIPSASSPGTVVTPPTPPSPGQPAGPATVAPTSNQPSSANSLVGVVVSGMVMLLSLAIVH